jgi:hypothetical protein
MAVLDHRDVHPTKEINGYFAVCNVCLVFAAILLMAYLLSLVV